MSESTEVMQGIAEKIGPALEASDLSAFSELLDPEVHWGPPGSSSPPCRNRDQVLSWYTRGKAAGVRAEILAIEVANDHIIVGLSVTNTSESPSRGDARWLVLTVLEGRVVNIVGFETRDDAATYAAMN